MTPEIAVLSKGLGGVHADCTDGNTTISGYGELDEPGWLDRCIDGAVVIDKRPALSGTDAVSVAWSSPLCDPTLADEEVNAAPDIPEYMLGPGGLQGEFLTGAALQVIHRYTESPDKPGPLDSVSPRLYAEYWREHGARVGVVRDGRIEWEDGEK